MESTHAGHEHVGSVDMAVHEWRVSQLIRLGLPELLAEIHADYVDWHQIARLVQRGCPALLAMRIAC
jgi:predicted component of type VI protein secretion system